jgi:hypothetical protein
MSALSILGESGVPHGCANPIYVISKEGDRLTFHLREEDASYLKTLLGKHELYFLDGTSFYAQLVSLEYCPNTETVLSAMPGVVMMRGVFSGIRESAGSVTSA